MSARSRFSRRLLDEHGIGSLTRYMAELLDRAERLTRQAISRIRPGTYSFEDYLDDDGINRDALVRIRATVTIDGSDLRISFAGLLAAAQRPAECRHCRRDVGDLLRPQGDHRSERADQRRLLPPAAASTCLRVRSSIRARRHRSTAAPSR